MNGARIPANFPDCLRQRQRSGVRAALIWGCVLLAGLSIYLIAYALTRHFTHLAWAKAINTALAAQDTAQSTALLQACRREQPALCRKPQFAMWQNQLEILLQNQAQKAAIFQHKLAQLQQMLKTPDSAPDMQIWSLQLAETARYAATESELAELRSIQLQCEALNRRQQLKHTRTAVELLQYLNEQLKVLSRLRQQNNFAEHRILSSKCTSMLKDLQQDYSTMPEIPQQVLQLRKLLQQEQLLLQQHEQLLQTENREFRQILNSAFAGEAVARAEKFLQRYPDGQYAAAVHNMLQAIQQLKLLQQDSSLDRRITAMEQNNQRAIALCKKEFNRIMHAALQGTVFELVLQMPTEKTGIKRFETIEKVSFRPLSNSGEHQIKFNSLTHGAVTGKFQADGYGTVTDGKRSWCGQLANLARPVGELPPAHWQELLYKLDLQLQTLDKTQFPRWLTEITPVIQQNKLLPDALRKQLSEALTQTGKCLGTSPEQFIFDYKLLKQCRNWLPVFAGLITVDSNKRVQHYLLRNTTADTAVWVLDGQKQPPWPILGTLGNGKLKAINLKQLLTNRIYVLAIPEQTADWPRQLRQYRQQAADMNLAMPTLPNFLTDWQGETSPSI